MNDRDEGLISRVALGDEDAFERLVRAYERRVHSTVYHYVGDSFATRDLAQEVFIKVWQKASSFKRRSRFSTWLYRIVVNHCLNYEAKRKLKSTGLLDESVAEPGPGLEATYEEKRKVMLVRDAMAKLPKRQRMALVLSKFEGKSYTEISEMMGVSLPAVESLIFRAKDNLRKTLAPLREKGEV